MGMFLTSFIDRVGGIMDGSSSVWLAVYFVSDHGA